MTGVEQYYGGHVVTIAGDPDIFPLVLIELIGSSVVMSGLCVPLMQGAVKMNSIFGIRTKKAFKSKENWDAINKFGGKAFMVCGVCLAAVFVPLTILFRHKPEILILIAYAPIFYIVPVILVYIYGAKLP